MCVAAIAWNAHPRWRLVIAANRDELHARPAAKLARWADGSGIIAGRDLQSGGTWLGVSEAGRCVLVTNYRVPGFPHPGCPSRGGLVTALLAGADPVDITISQYNPYNLFCADPQAAHVLSNFPKDSRQQVPGGVHGLSNGGYELPWPKTVRLCGAVGGWLAGPALDLAELFAPLADAAPLSASESDTGPEARFSSVFIRDARYGTRCSTVVGIGADGDGTIIERSFDAAGTATGETAIDFRWS